MDRFVGPAVVNRDQANFGHPSAFAHSELPGGLAAECETSEPLPPLSREIDTKLKASVEELSADKSNPSFARTILLVDDVDDIRATTVELLSSFGFTVESARSAEEALASFDQNTHDVVVTDNSMPGMSGAEMAHVIKLRSPSTPILMFTGSPPADKSCLDLVLQKPALAMELKLAVEELLADKSR